MRFSAAGDAVQPFSEAARSFAASSVMLQPVCEASAPRQTRPEQGHWIDQTAASVGRAGPGSGEHRNLHKGAVVAFITADMHQAAEKFWLNVSVLHDRSERYAAIREPME